MGAKAYKLTIPGLKKTCDVFAVDRTGCNSKDELVDLLLDFLGEPSEQLLKGSGGGEGTKGSKGKKNAAAAAEAAATDAYSDLEDGDDDDNNDEGGGKEGAMPDDAALRRWVKAYVRCHNMKKVTSKDALEIASEKFGVDVAEKKSTLKDMLTEEM
jgi:DEK C terminal domain